MNSCGICYLGPLFTIKFTTGILTQINNNTSDCIPFLHLTLRLKPIRVTFQEKSCKIHAFLPTSYLATVWSYFKKRQLTTSHKPLADLHKCYVLSHHSKEMKSNTKLSKILFMVAQIDIILKQSNCSHEQ